LAYDNRTTRPRRTAREDRTDAGPAHPLPEHRSGRIDYDRYLERSTDSFKIFSAGERRRRRHWVLVLALFAVLVALVALWAVLSQG
jgi:hypothetical protein